MSKFFTANKPLIFILTAMFLNFLSFSILFPLMPFMVGKYVRDPGQIAFFVGIILSVFALCQFFSAPGLGVLSDKFGRKPILLISMLGSVIGYLVLGFAGALWMLFLGRIIDGLTGGNVSTIYAYMADITKPQDRGKSFGLLGAAAGVGMIIGPVTGGFLGTFNVAIPIFIAALITFITIILGYFILPESLHHSLRATNFSLKHLNPFQQFSHIFSIPILRRLMISGLIFFVAMNGMYATNAVFFKDVFSWNPAQIGLILFIIGFVDIFSQGFLINKLLPKFGEIKVSALGLILTAVGFFLVTLTSVFPSVFLIYFSLIILNIGDGLFEPSQAGLISKSVGPHMQGRIQGGAQGIQSLARIAGPFIAALAYGYLRGFLYFSEGILVVISLVILLMSISIIKSHKVEENRNETR